MSCRPTAVQRDRAAGYSAQKEIVRFSGQDVVGWKIAATSAAGQKHIGVDGPLAGPLLANRVLADGATVPLDGNIMMVAEAEFAFKFARRPAEAREPIHAGTKCSAPSSRCILPSRCPTRATTISSKVGAPQLIADTACADWFVLGAPTAADWRARDLVAHAVAAYRNGEKVATGSGANVLGDPRIALTWLVNELRTYADGIAAGQFVTTGTCVVPVPIQRGDTFRADFGEFGTVDVKLV